MNALRSPSPRSFSPAAHAAAPVCRPRRRLPPVLALLLIPLLPSIDAAYWTKAFHKHAGAVHEKLVAAGIPNVLYSAVGTDHEWQTWRLGLKDLAQRLFKK